jgi:acyl-CoA oxidase
MGKEDLDFLPDFPPGPLDRYRKQASFNWKTMAVVIEQENLLRFKVN